MHRKMNDVPISTFERAIQAIHHAKGKLLARERVNEMFGGDVVWQGEVLVFELLDHPSAHLCYA
jgi:hypothetical protein